MQIEVASQRILLLKDLLSAKQASDIAWQKAAKQYIDTRPR